MNADAMVSGEYLKAAAIGDENPTYTIRSVSLEQLASLKSGAAEDKTVQKGVIWFTDTPLGWVMNKTNVECIKAVWGNDTNAWLGKRVTLRTEMTKTGLGIRLKGSPDIDREIIAKVKLFKRKAQEFTIVPTGNRRPTNTPPQSEFDKWAAAVRQYLNLDPDAVAEWFAATGKGDLTTKGPDVLKPLYEGLDGGADLASFRSSPFGGAS
jgi:hypothetical protein